MIKLIDHITHQGPTTSSPLVGPLVSQLRWPSWCCWLVISVVQHVRWQSLLNIANCKQSQSLPHLLQSQTVTEPFHPNMPSVGCNSSSRALCLCLCQCCLDLTLVYICPSVPASSHVLAIISMFKSSAAIAAASQSWRDDSQDGLTVSSRRFANGDTFD